MKKLLVALCSFSVLFFSCKEKNSENVSVQPEPKKEAVKIQKKTALSRIIYTGWDLYEERSDGKMYAVSEAENGDEVIIYLNSDDSIDQKNAIRHLQNGKEEPLDFVHVQYEDKDYWTRDIFLSGPNVSNLAVVQEDAFIYSAPDGLSLTTSQVSEGTFAALENQGEGTNGFYKVVIYNGRPFGKEIYLKDSALTFNETMKELVRVFSKLDEKTKPEIADELVAVLVQTAKASSDTTAQEYIRRKVTDENSKVSLSEELYSAIENMYVPERISE